MQQSSRYVQSNHCSSPPHLMKRLNHLMDSMRGWMWSRDSIHYSPLSHSLLHCRFERSELLNGCARLRHRCGLLCDSDCDRSTARIHLDHLPRNRARIHPNRRSIPDHPNTDGSRMDRSKDHTSNCKMAPVDSRSMDRSNTRLPRSGGDDPSYRMDNSQFRRTNMGRDRRMDYHTRLQL
jgi:hypothetical protein